MENNYSYIQKGNKVWCLNPLLEKKRDPQCPPFICGEITFIDESKKLIEVSTIDKKIRFVQTMPFVNDEDINIPDMAMAIEICEIDLLNNLSNRLTVSHEQFTNVGPTLLLVNPYKKDPSIYSNEKIEDYINLHKENPPEKRKTNDYPHLYDLVLISIEQLVQTGNNQAIIISGESGAGKTEAAKNAMNCIIYYFQGKTTEERKANMKGFSSRATQEPLEKKILSCNPILEAFGNCKTLRNDNSSRFGKYVTINIDFEEKRVLGASIKTYLLEKSRITTQAKNERTFHIFYQLINGADSDLLNSLFLEDDIKIYNYLNNSGCTKLKNVDDSKLYKETIECFEINDFSDIEIKCILKIVAAVLLIGNLRFAKKGDGYEIENINIAKNICNLLACNIEDFRKALTLKITSIRGEVYESHLSLDDCMSSRDSLAKEIYNRLFSWIVMKMNSRLKSQFDISVDESENDQNIKYIGLLDIFGFECFDSNSFEQLCINYTNEQLQHIYTDDFFQSEIDEMNKEGLASKTGFISFTNNQPIIDLIDSSPNGIFAKLDDCSYQNKKDEYFVEILKSELNTNKYITLPKMKNDLNIKIKHFAKEVPYDCANFVRKNKDELKYSMVKIFANSDNKIIKRIFFNSLDEEGTESQIKYLEDKTKTKTSKFISGKFKGEMQALVRELKSCQCNYIRCLKPNELKKEFFITPMFLFNQIKYLGIFDTIKVRKEGFPIRIEYNKFFDLYKFLFSQIVYSEDTDKNKTLQIIGALLPNLDEIHDEENSPQFLLGKTKIYMKQEFKLELEKSKEKLFKIYRDSSEIIKVAVYHYKKLQRLEETKKNIIFFQRYFRFNKKKINRKKKIEKINNIQSLIKTYVSKCSISTLPSHCIKAQTILRTFIEQKKYEKKMFQLKCASMRLDIFIDEIEKRKRARFRDLSKYLLQQAIDKVIWTQYNDLYQRLRPFFISFLTKKKYYDTYKTAKIISLNFNKKRVMSIFQMNLLFQKIEDRKRSYKIIYKNINSTSCSNYFYALRISIKTIQKYITRYLDQKKIIGNYINNYFQEENKEENNNEIKLNMSIFPMIRFLNQNNQQFLYSQEMFSNSNNQLIDNYNNMNKKMQKKVRRCSSLEKIEYNNSSNNYYNSNYNNNNINNNNYNNYNSIAKGLNPQQTSYNLLSKNPSNASMYFNIGAEYLQKNPEINNYLTLLEHDEFESPKIEFFARILSVDILLDLNEIYESNWGEEFRGIYEKNMNNHTPIELIAIGDTNTLMVNSLGKIYSFGWNNNSQCGISNKASIQSFILPNIISNNNNQNEEMSENNNNVYNKNTPLPVVYYEKKKNISYISGINARYINIFNESCFMISDKGDCYSFGNNENGQLGLGNPFPVENPTLIKILKGKAKCIKSCQDFTLSLTKDNEIFLWFSKSKNKINKNKLSNNYNNNTNTNNSLNNNIYNTSEESKELYDFIESGVLYGVPLKINIFNKKIKINQIACGYNFAMLLSSSGILFGLGNNKNGELGLTEDQEEGESKDYFYTPIQNYVLSDYYQEKLISVKCGFKHTVCLTSSKRVFVWGNNKYGQLGTYNYETQIIPVEIGLYVFPVERIIQIQAGFRSTIFFTENRNIYYTGKLDKENISKYPVKFNVKLKSPEICVENKFYIVRILTSWSKNASIFYATVADVRRFKTQSINKLNKVIDILAKNWKDENSTCPRIDTISNYFSSTYMK